MYGNVSVTPLPCEHHGAPDPITQKRTAGDVVEPDIAPGPGIHTHDVDDVDAFVAAPAEVKEHPATFEVDHPEGYGPTYDDGGDEHEHRNDDDRRSALRDRDRAERRDARGRSRREHLERRARWRSRPGAQRGRRTARRTREMAPRDEHPARRRAHVSHRLANGSFVHDRHRSSRSLPTPARPLGLSHGVDVAAQPGALRRFAAGPLHGSALAIYFVLLPFVVVSKWELTSHQTEGRLIRVLLVALGLFWVLFICQVVRNVIRLRRGSSVSVSGSAWLAGLFVALLPFLISPAMTPTPHSHARARVTAVTSAAIVERSARSPHDQTPSAPRIPVPLGIGASGVVPMALMAKRRSDVLRSRPRRLSDEEIDATIEILRSANPLLVAQLRSVIADRVDGVVRVGDDFGYVPLSDASDPVVVCLVSDNDETPLFAFAREGGRLRVPVEWSKDRVSRSLIGLHDGGRLSIAHDQSELLNSFAERILHRTLVVYLGAASELEPGLRSCTVTIVPVQDPTFLQEWSDDPPHDDESTKGLHDAPRPRTDTGIRAELLRAEPTISGLHEPFMPTLRRRCVEMVAYLALHRHESVTGDRLRSRVLTHADVDASTRTLANTASAVRRSLGVDALGPRLHAVTSQGLYVTHATTSDLEEFHELIARARQLNLIDAAPLNKQALTLVRGEPLSSALRGFEWFLVEGHWAHLQRDGEWAALALHQFAMNSRDYELAFWAITKGRLIDPHSDALNDALVRVPRLRQFGGD